jgi:hypothetical protein
MFTNKKKRVLSLIIILAMMVSLFAGCSSEESLEDNGQEENVQEETNEDYGTIMWLSNLSSGVQYESSINYLDYLCSELGYEFQVVFGDPYNDPAGNLAAVKNNMSDDIVGLIVSQDGGVKDIMSEYPDLYVVGYNLDMRSAFNADGVNAEVIDNEKFLGAIVDGFADGADLGRILAEKVVEENYKTISIIKFPFYAFPNLDEADMEFRKIIETHNNGVADDEKITIVGETKVLEFEPLEETYFFEEGHDELDAIIGLCAGVDFIYPVLKTAIANGAASPDTHLLTSGINKNGEILADIGEDKIIQYITISPGENIAWAFAMLDNAMVGGMYNDFEGPRQIDSISYVIEDQEDVENVFNNAFTGTADVTKTQISMEELKNVLTRFNEDATYEELNALFASDQLTTDALE